MLACHQLSSIGGLGGWGGNFMDGRRFCRNFRLEQGAVNGYGKEPRGNIAEPLIWAWGALRDGGGSGRHSCGLFLSSVLMLKIVDMAAREMQFTSYAKFKMFWSWGDISVYAKLISQAFTIYLSATRFGDTTIFKQTTNTNKQTNPTDNKESEKTKHAHMKMEINEIATKTNTS
jgi:hypothetical protein